MTAPAAIEAEGLAVGYRRRGRSRAVLSGLDLAVGAGELVGLLGANGTGKSTLALYFAQSRDAERFTARQRLPTQGVPRHPQLTVEPRGEVLVTWDELAGGTRRIALARGAPDGNGSVRFTRSVVGAAESGGYPVVAAADGGIAVAWTAGPAGQTVVRVEHVQR